MSSPKYKRKTQTRKCHSTQRSLDKCGRTSIKPQLPSMKRHMKKTKRKLLKKSKSTKPNTGQSQKEKEKEADQPQTPQKDPQSTKTKRKPKDEH